MLPGHPIGLGQPTTGGQVLQLMSSEKALQRKSEKQNNSRLSGIESKERGGVAHGLWRGSGSSRRSKKRVENLG